MHPARFFLMIGGVFGLILVFLIPPMGGGNEEFNFQRAVSIAYGGFFIKPVQTPQGINELIRESSDFFHEGLKAPFAYNRDDFTRANSIRLHSETLETLYPNPIAILNPAAYLPQAATIHLAAQLETKPLVLLYLGRLTGLLCALGLTFAAIRIIPSHQYTLCALALLPPLLFGRSTLDADQITNSLAFFFLALVLRESVRQDAITRSTLWLLALSAFIMAQCKTAYLFLPMLVLGIPQSRFSGRSRCGWITLIIVPGIVASALWTMQLKYSYFSGIVYTTWAGSVNPDAQTSWIIQYPLEYLVLLCKTIVSASFLLTTFVQCLGVFGPPVMLPPLVLGLIAVGIYCAIRTDPSAGGVVYPRALQWYALILAISTLLIILTLLYIQWNGVRATTIHGFQGRYLYPLLPLLILTLPKIKSPARPQPYPRWFRYCAGTVLLATVVKIVVTYY